MAGTSRSASKSRNRTDTLIGAGARVDGNISFCGVLSIQGEVHGDVSCEPGADGSAVVGESGNVTGTIKAPHIVVSGHVHGFVYSLEPTEIQQGGRVVGAVSQREMDSHERDVNGIPKPPGNHIAQAPPSQENLAAGVKTMTTANRFGERLAGLGKFGIAIAVLVPVVMAVLANRSPKADATTVAETVTKENASTKDALSTPLSTAPSLPQAAPGVVIGNAAPLAPTSEKDTKAAVQASPQVLLQPVSDNINPAKLVVIQGVNPGKPAGVFFIFSKEPAVLFKKTRQYPAETRIDVSAGAMESIAIAQNDVFRVDQGRAASIFYQGRKVAAQTIASGGWMSFVPLSPSKGSE